jgi:hypothetical protein
LCPVDSGNCGAAGFVWLRRQPDSAAATSRDDVDVTLTWESGETLTLAIPGGTGDLAFAKTVCRSSPLQIKAVLFPSR